MSGRWPARTTEERFWEKVEKTETCWEWTASVSRGGYGQFNIGRTVVRAPRFAYENLVGPIPERMTVDHICHNPPCVKPDHLRLATNKENNENKSGAHANSKSGIRGVSWCTTNRKWRAVVGHNGRSYSGGYYTTMAEAEAAVVALRLELFTHNDLDRNAA